MISWSPFKSRFRIASAIASLYQGITRPVVISHSKWVPDAITLNVPTNLRDLLLFLKNYFSIKQKTFFPFLSEGSRQLNFFMKSRFIVSICSATGYFRSETDKSAFTSLYVSDIIAKNMFNNKKNTQKTYLKEPVNSCRGSRFYKILWFRKFLRHRTVKIYPAQIWLTWGNISDRVFD